MYLYWTCSAPAPPAEDPHTPTQAECADTPVTGADSNNILAVPLRGNRIDRFTWNGTNLTFERNLSSYGPFSMMRLRNPPNRTMRRRCRQAAITAAYFGSVRDRKLYLTYEDQGRRGLTQNLPIGPPRRWAARSE